MTMLMPEPIDTVRAKADAGELWDPFDAIVRTRRAVREFSPEPISERDLEQVIDAAIVAPTSSNLQQFELYRVRTPSAREKLVRACMSQSAARTAAELVVCVARWDLWNQTRREMAAWLETQPDVPNEVRHYYDYLIPLVLAQGPFSLFGRAKATVVRPFLWKFPLPRGPYTREDMRVWAIKSSALACENLMLAARAKGLDSCPLEGADPIRIAKILGLRRSQWKRGWDITMVIALGHRANDAKVSPQWRRDRGALVHEI